MAKRCSVACDTPTGILQCELELPDEATMELALQAARRALGDAATDWEHAVAGIYGQVHGRDIVPLDGDRIEVYRPLLIDARAQRRVRAARATRSMRDPAGGKRR
jgi:putative ubiquitin-RnfH superfamily antitoxin RatB of RatAB toxin-antitoxin module